MTIKDLKDYLNNSMNFTEEFDNFEILFPFTPNGNTEYAPGDVYGSYLDIQNQQLELRIYRK